MNRKSSMTKQRIQVRSIGGMGIGLLSFAMVLVVCTDTRAYQAKNQAMPLAQAAQDAVQPVADDETPVDPEKYIGGAPLKTDPDLMERLKKADALRQDGNIRVASKLWQSVLGESGDILFTQDGETYFALTERVESILAELPASGLSAYRIGADAAAREILAQRKGDYDLDTLSQVVKGYFMSSFGDDAAYELGCIYLDQFDFVGAARLLRKIADHYPDPSVPMDDVWLRIAIAYTYVGDRESAEQAMENARQAGADTESRLYEAISELMLDSPELSLSNTASNQWVTRLGSVKRLGQMPTLPEEYDGLNLKADWQYYFAPRATYLLDAYLGQTIAEFAPTTIQESVGKQEETMIKAWRKGRWRPSGHLLFHDDNVFFKTGADITVWNRELQSEPVWRPLWLNQFAIDEASFQWKQMYDTYRYESTGRPKTAPSQPHHIQMFGDQIAQSMTLHRGVLYNIEGREYSWKTDQIPSSRRNKRGYNYGSVPRRTRTNRLAAYNAQNGKIMWRLPTIELLEVARADHQTRGNPNDDEEDTEDFFEDIGFMAAPVGFGELLLAPVNIGGSIWIYALDSQNKGALVWKSYLCDEPGGGSQPWSPIHLSIDGSTAYANCGTGVVFAIDPMTGGIRFARRYSRTGEANNFMQSHGGNAELLELDGWMEDLVIPLANELVVLASDHNVVWAIDRQSASFRWKTENRPFGDKFDYLIGVNEDHVYLGGMHSVAAISIKAQGRWAWVHNFGNEVSLGRAMLTGNGIYVPLNDRILKLGLDGKDGAGDILADMKVRLATSAPIGNLYSDGHRIWVVGGNRLYALGPDDGSIPDPVNEKESKDGDSNIDKTKPPDGTAKID